MLARDFACGAPAALTPANRLKFESLSLRHCRFEGPSLTCDFTPHGYLSTALMCWR